MKPRVQQGEGEKDTEQRQLYELDAEGRPCEAGNIYWIKTVADRGDRDGG